MATTYLPAFVLVAFLAVDAWVYTDARAQQNAGTPVVCTIGSFVIDTPIAWFVVCLVLFIVFVPLYIVGRAR